MSGRTPTQEPERRVLLLEAIRLATENAKIGGGPFGAVIARDGKIIATGVNQVIHCNDPTAHAEVVAIRQACSHLGRFSLEGFEIYASCEPCPMCLSAIYWARLDAVWFSADHNDATSAGFDDARIYKELALESQFRSLPQLQIASPEALESFQIWKALPQKTEY